MQKRTFLLLHFLFAVIVLIELAGRFLDNIRLEYMAKPLIMITCIGAQYLIMRGLIL